ncbi:hypothetical protein JTB14_006323 [Gonioctena quinquepunctata]|nr:hypothetical protein JTB14_006323 [Gonioctena quinquepunctata]
MDLFPRSVTDTTTNSKYRQAVVVFDGYSDDLLGGTKTTEHMRSTRKHTSVDKLFDESMTPTTPKNNFLANLKNKGRLIFMRSTQFPSAGLEPKQSEEDAYTLIRATALSLAPPNDTGMVVGEDVDLLVILINLCQAENAFFLIPGKENVFSAAY